MTNLPEGNWTIDPIHSSVSFKTRHGFANFRAGFNGVTGSLENGVLSGEVPVNGIILPIQAFTDHLLSADFFDAEQFPAISFKSTSLTDTEVTGDFTLKGVTKPVTGTVSVLGTGVMPTPNGEVTKLGIDITATISVSDFGGFQHGLGDPTTIEISLELDKA